MFTTQRGAGITSDGLPSRPFSEDTARLCHDRTCLIKINYSEIIVTHLQGKDRSVSDTLYGSMQMAQHSPSPWSS